MSSESGSGACCGPAPRSKACLEPQFFRSRLGPAQSPQGKALLHRPSYPFQIFAILASVHPVYPVARPLNGPCVEYAIAATLQGPREAGPRPRLRSLNETGSERISLHVPAHIEKVQVCLYGDGFVASLVHRPGSDGLVKGVPALRVSSCKPSHKLRHLVAALWPKNEMPVIRHNAVGKQTHFRKSLCFNQNLFYSRIVCR